jgi:hypothetical protein
MKCTFKGHPTKFRGVEKIAYGNKIITVLPTVFLDGFHHFFCRKKIKITSEENAEKNG